MMLWWAWTDWFRFRWSGSVPVQIRATAVPESAFYSLGLGAIVCSYSRLTAFSFSLSLYRIPLFGEFVWKWYRMKTFSYVHVRLCLNHGTGSLIHQSVLFVKLNVSISHWGSNAWLLFQANSFSSANFRPKYIFLWWNRPQVYHIIPMHIPEMFSIFIQSQYTENRSSSCVLENANVYLSSIFAFVMKNLQEAERFSSNTRHWKPDISSPCRCNTAFLFFSSSFFVVVSYADPSWCPALHASLSESLLRRSRNFRPYAEASSHESRRWNEERI